MTGKTPALLALLADLRAHPAFDEFLAQVARPAAPVFKPKQAGNAAATEMWIYQSGVIARDRVWREFLTGHEVPRDSEDDQSSVPKE